tara:strand:+ start:798 stop:1181 length:384 start_codon:yes stop_codon:yes gene_type:complete
MSKNNNYKWHVYKFDEGTQIMLDRSYCDISGVEYQLASHVKLYPGRRKRTHKVEIVSEEIHVVVTPDGLKTFETNLRKGAETELRKKHDDYIMEFLTDDLENKLMFMNNEDEEDSALFTQVSKNLEE